MRLLVSAATAADAVAARDGGADVVDAKDPAVGALGAVSLDVLGQMREVVGVRPLSAALGDAVQAERVEDLAREYAAGGASLVKLPVGHATNTATLWQLCAAVARGAATANTGAGAIAVTFADADDWLRRPNAFVSAAARAGVIGVLLDTARKDGPRLCELVPRAMLQTWIEAVRDAGLLAAVAGRLTSDDLGELADAGADIVGVRGAACDGGRLGIVTASRVMALRSACARTHQPVTS